MRKYLFLCMAVSMAAISCEQTTPTLRVATYNLRMDTHEDSVNAWKYRKENVKALVEYNDLDLIGTQEGYAYQLQQVCELADYAYVGAGRDDGKKAGEHSAIIYRSSRLELLEEGNFWYSPTPEQPSKGWDAKCCNRLCSWAKFCDKLTRRTFFVFNSHFDHEGNTARMESAKLLLAKVKQIAQDAPVLCMGDLNADKNSPAIKTIAAELADARSASMSPPYGPAGTFTTRFQNPIHERIDYIFVSSSVQVLRYAVITDNNGTYYPSDHLPVVVDLTIQ